MNCEYCSKEIYAYLCSDCRDKLDKYNSIEYALQLAVDEIQGFITVRFECDRLKVLLENIEKQTGIKPTE